MTANHSPIVFQLLKLIEPNIQSRNDNHNKPFVQLLISTCLQMQDKEMRMSSVTRQRKHNLWSWGRAWRIETRQPSPFHWERCSGRVFWGWSFVKNKTYCLTNRWCEMLGSLRMVTIVCNGTGEKEYVLHPVSQGWYFCLHQLQVKGIKGLFKIRQKLRSIFATQGCLEGHIPICSHSTRFDINFVGIHWNENAIAGFCSLLLQFLHLSDNFSE